MDEMELSLRRRSQALDIVRRFLRNRAAVAGFFIIFVLTLIALFPRQIAPFDYNKQDLAMRYLSPSAEHPFGTDEFGRDILSRVIYGCRTSLEIGVASVAISCVIGVALGCISGYYSSLTDNIIMRLVDVLLAIPNLMLAISIVAAFGISRLNLVLAIGIGSMGAFARIVRASVLSIREQEFIEVARAIGASDARIIFRHILPNCLAPIIVQVSMSIGAAILSAAGLSFIGLGVPPPTPEWGAMLSSGRAYMRDYWFVVTFPGVAIMLTVFAFNLFGDGLRDALDPKLKT